MTTRFTFRCAVEYGLLNVTFDKKTWARLMRLLEVRDVGIQQSREQPSRREVGRDDRVPANDQPGVASDARGRHPGDV
jgi:hypothetical protein